MTVLMCENTRSRVGRRSDRVMGMPSGMYLGSCRSSVVVVEGQCSAEFDRGLVERSWEAI